MGAMLVRHEPMSVAAVRRALAADLAQHGVAPECVDDITLVASELVSNAVRHAELAPDVDLDVAWTIEASSVLLGVADTGEGHPQLRVAASNEPTGRGLSIVDALSSAWGVEHLPRGKRVWARVRTR